jgi:hypothetical protein
MGFELVNRFSNHLQVTITDNYNTIADFHTTNHYTLSLLSLVSLVFTVLHNGYSSAMFSIDRKTSSGILRRVFLVRTDPKDGFLHSYRRENIKSYKKISIDVSW